LNRIPISENPNFDTTSNNPNSTQKKTIEHRDSYHGKEIGASNNSNLRFGELFNFLISI